MSDITIVEPETAAELSVADALPASPEVDAETPLVEQDLLVEDLSIDGMCGVY